VPEVGLYCEETPVEKFYVEGREIFVKRDDLYGVPPCPPLGKLRGLRILLKELNERGQRLVGCWDTRISKLGQGLAAAALEFPRMRTIVSYPTRRGAPTPPAVMAAEKLGATIHPVPGGRIAISFARARNYIESKGGVMLPFGLECEEAVEGVAREAARLDPELAAGTIVLCCGSGVTLAGLLTGLPRTPRRIIGLSSGRSLSKIESCVRRHVGVLPHALELHDAMMPYSEVPDVECPFPSHPNYDLKAWHHLVENLNDYSDPVLFWNIGA
jgi:1-aminocyclopropane-1-carboxylate deaminase/D-cysteine desulfhydrase-like pyridoxal-dependent ACC family enzyme